MRKLLKRKVFKILLIIVLLTTCYLIWENNHIVVTNYTNQSSKLPESFDGFRIAQISDLHNARFGKDNRRLLEKLKGTEPDIIVLTGDLIDSRRTNTEIALSFVKEASSIAPTYYVPGNHESRIEDIDSFYADLQSAGVILLLDDHCFIEKGTDMICISGLIDPAFKTEEEWTHTLNKSVPDKNLYTVLLSHRPELFEDYHADLVLAGHAHGGPVCIPYIGGLFAPAQGFLPQYDSGSYVKDTTTMVVSRGIGNSLFPARVNNPPEIVVIELKSEK